MSRAVLTTLCLSSISCRNKLKPINSKNERRKKRRSFFYSLKREKFTLP